MLVAAFVLSLPAVTPRIYASDEIQYFSYLRSLWFDRDVSFENEYRYFFEPNIGRGEGFHATFLEQYTDAGRRPSFATIGCARLWSPFYAVADLVTRVRGGPAGWLLASLCGRGRLRFGVLRVCRDPPVDRRRARRLAGRGLLAGDPGLARHAAGLLHDVVAADLARLLGVRGGAVRHRLAARARRWTVGGAIALGRPAR